MQMLLLPAVVLAVLSAACLFAKTEGFRASGRVCGGLSWILFGTFLLHLPHDAAAMLVVSSWCLIITGVITVGSGARKFARRNIAA